MPQSIMKMQRDGGTHWNGDILVGGGPRLVIHDPCDGEMEGWYIVEDIALNVEKALSVCY